MWSFIAGTLLGLHAGHVFRSGLQPKDPMRPINLGYVHPASYYVHGGTNSSAKRNRSRPPIVMQLSPHRHPIVIPSPPYCHPSVLPSSLHRHPNRHTSSDTWWIPSFLSFLNEPILPFENLSFYILLQFVLRAYLVRNYIIQRLNRLQLHAPCPRRLSLLPHSIPTHHSVSLFSSASSSFFSYFPSSFCFTLTLP